MEIVDVTVIIPTYNEWDNLSLLLEEILNLKIRPHQIIISDDSDLPMPDKLGKIFAEYPWIVCDHHLVRLGLSGSVYSAWEKAQTTWVAIMDGDGQHPIVALEKLLLIAKQYSDIDIILPYRHHYRGQIDGMSKGRSFISFATKFWGKLLLPPVRGVKDPLGGFFAVNTKTIPIDFKGGMGWKLLLDILVKTNWEQACQFEYNFQPRMQGVSNANMKIGKIYLKQTLALRNYYHKNRKNYGKKHFI